MLLLGCGTASPVWHSPAVATLVCLACVPALVWTASRGAWAGTAAGALVVAGLALGPRPSSAARRRPYGWAMAAAGALAALGLLAVGWDHAALVRALLAGHNGSGTERTLVWLAAWHMIRDHPLLGIGPDQFLYYYSNLYTTHPYWITTLNGHPTLAWREPTLAHPHDLLLDMWLSVGLLGLVAFVVVLVTFARRAARLWCTRRGTWAGALALGLGGSMLAALVHGLVDSAYFEPDLALIFWLTVAVLLLAERYAAPRQRPMSGPATPHATSAEAPPGA